MPREFSRATSRPIAGCAIYERRADRATEPKDFPRTRGLRRSRRLVSCAICTGHTSSCKQTWMLRFSLEDFFDEYEHRSGLINLASSDAKPWSVTELQAKGIALTDVRFSLAYPDVR